MFKVFKLDEFLKYIPLISLFIIICSLIKNYIYYEYFGININQYVGLSEFTLLFISEIKSYLVFVLSLIFFSPFIFFKNWLQDGVGRKDFPFRLTKIFSLVFVIFFPLRILLTETDLLNIIEGCFDNLILLFITVLLLLKYEIKIIRNVYVFFCVLSLVIFSFSQAYLDIEKVERNILNSNIEFIYENEIIRSNENRMFIGKTYEYIFLFDRCNFFTEIYRVEDIKNLKVKKL